MVTITDELPHEVAPQEVARMIKTHLDLGHTTRPLALAVAMVKTPDAVPFFYRLAARAAF